MPTAHERQGINANSNDSPNGSSISRPKEGQTADLARWQILMMNRQIQRPTGRFQGGRPSDPTADRKNNRSIGSPNISSQNGRLQIKSNSEHNTYAYAYV